MTHLSSVEPAPVEDQVGRYRELAEAGVQTAIVGLPDVGDIAPIEAFADVIGAFRPPDAPAPA